ncbi:AMP-binding protein [Povalibacter sp.]|uniref:AMP-binding protein n=1 Tax=Povalibacter sp. TaxID=1962978 RepID=UPI002F4082FE
MRALDRPERNLEIERGKDGATYLRCGHPYQEGLSLIDLLQRAQDIRPDTPFLAERDGSGGWRTITYAQAWHDTGAIATWLMRHGFGPDGPPVMILSENSIEHALLMLGTLRAGAAAVPVSPTYSFGNDLARLGYALELIEPGLVYAQDGSRYAAALSHASAPGRLTLTGEQFVELLREVDEGALQERRSRITRDTVAKILLTSGSTGRPKGVINTHGNLAAGAQMVRLVSEPFRTDRIHTLVDWLPWHHTFGGNAQFNGILAVAGTLYIDNGRPAPGQFAATIENLRDIRPTGFGCVPGVYGMLAEALEKDADLRQKFFSNLRWLSYGGALLPQPLWERMQRLAVQELGERLPFGTGWGMTETAATGVGVYWNTNRTGLVGLPQPGAVVKLVPTNDDRMELRIKGPHVLPAYHRAPELNAAAFDEEGFFRTGDAVRWVDAEQPIEGLEYAGRLAEDFKLLSGTWVQASLVRRDLVAALQPYVADAVICAPNQSWLGALIWTTVPVDDKVRGALALQLAAFNAARQGTASTIARMLVLIDPPCAEAGEITDKRSINQRRVMERRVADVAKLYAEPIAPGMILPAEK